MTGILRTGGSKMGMVRNEKGFTLFELIVVIAIIGVLMAVFFPKLEGRKMASQITAVESDMMRIYEAASTYKANKSLVSFDAVTDITVLQDAGLIAKNAGDDFKGPFNNKYTCTPTGATSLQLLVTSGTLPSKEETKTSESVCDMIKARFDKRGYTATCNGDELSVTL